MVSSLAALLVALALATLWLVSVILRDASVIDVFWGPGFVLIAWTCAWEQGLELDILQALLLGLVSVWGLRLGAHLGWRKRGEGEDRRYRAMRERAGPKFWLISALSVFALQGVIMFVVSLPVQAALLGEGGDGFSPLFAVLPALALWLLGFTFETLGDLQLARFAAQPENAGEVMDRGLWAWTRHPNYFGDFALWWGHFGLAWALGAPWWTIVSPVIMSILLMRVSGVPLLERSLRARRPAYADYMRRTSAFFPRPPRKLSARRGRPQ